jgi:hypothetical protein
MRARLRHLKRHGVPSGISSPGTGRWIAYTRTQVLELLFATALEAVGLKPVTIATLARQVVQIYLRHESDPLAQAVGPALVIAYPATSRPEILPTPAMREWAADFGAVAIGDLRGHGQLLDLLRSEALPPVYVTIEPGRLATRFLAELDRLASAK